MVFSSLTFFLPAVLLVYYLVSRPARNYVLLVFSLIFYAWGEPAYVFLMLGSIAGNYLLALWIGHSRQKGKEKPAVPLMEPPVFMQVQDSEPSSQWQSRRLSESC